MTRDEAKREQYTGRGDGHRDEWSDVSDAAAAST